MRNRWLYIILVLLALSIAVNFGLLYIALSNRGELIEDNPYERGLAFQETIDKTELVRAQGWQVTISFPRPDLVAVKLLDRNGLPLEVANLALRAVRPSNSKQDQFVAFTTATAAGSYSATLPLAPGLWLFELEIDYQGKKGLHRERRILS